MEAEDGMTKRILKWTVMADDKVQEVGGGPIVLVGAQLGGLLVQVWTEETGDEVRSTRKVVVVGTGHPVPQGATHLGSVVSQPFVWHLYEVK